ncbi:anionic trypsin-like isoform X1 [Portunus trituberculatus]|uniref:anionic trypsin-like isoform X1 n=2 Tax=Portunus trituberculatus TaxID=210409 RepID=UPI001E1CE303|nr:anionic trypsin-like isoform X1 [Portunus trituberculatus]
MQSTNTLTWRAVFLVVVVVVEGLGVQVAASYSTCVRPMAAPECDSDFARTSDVDDKIAGGHVAEPGSTPWLVSLMDTHYVDPVPFCSGTLISNRWVITSASCVSSYKDKYDNIKVVLGEYDLTVNEGWERTRCVNYIALHPDYDYYSHHADVALVRLSLYILYSQRIGTLELPPWWQKETNDPQDAFTSGGQLYTIAGWGRIGESGELSPVIRVAQVPLLSHEDCMEVYPEFANTIICAGNLTHGGLDSCQGDMGGALARDGYIRGVSSFSVGCGRPGYPGVYTDVTQMMDWICSLTNLLALWSLDRIPACQ